MKFSMLLAALLFASVARGEPIVVKMSTVAPADTPWERVLRKAKQRIQDESGGKVKIQLYLGGVKGGEEALVRQCAQGSLQMVGVTTAAAAQIVKELDLLELPYLYDNYEQADRMLKAVEPIVRELLAKKGLVFYMWSENGWRGFASKSKAILELADLRGQKMRSQESSVHLATWKNYGAEPVPISVTEVLTALQTGVVDGFDNTPLYAFAANWYQGVKHWTVSDHIFQPGIVVYNKRWLDGLPKEIQAVLTSSADDIVTEGRKLIRGLTPDLLENFRVVGIQVHSHTPAQRASFAKAAQPVWETMRKKTTADGRKLLDALLRAKSEK